MKKSSLITHHSSIHNGFTLIELLVVVGILAVLTTVLLATFNPLDQLQKANDGRKKSDLAQIQRALETYYQDNNSYPPSSVATDTCGSPQSSCPYRIKNSSVRDWGEEWQPYINVLPKDPGGNKYVYYSSGGQSYYLYASLDRGSLDLQVCQNLDTNGECPSIASNGISAKSCGGPCNYGVSSPNTSP